DDAVAALLADEPAVAVAAARDALFGAGDARREGGARVDRDSLLSGESLTPLEEVLGRGIDAAVAHDGGRLALVRPREGRALARVAEGAVRDGARRIGVGRNEGRHAERLEDVRGEKRREALPRGLFDDEREQRVARVAVAELRARREEELLRGRHEKER